jgi:carnitine O-acetyltransferase
MLDPEQTVSTSLLLYTSYPIEFFSPLQDEYRSTLFRHAVARHLQYAAWAADGQGVDRHLFGLKKMLKDGEPTPKIYEDPAYAKTNHWELSTSQLSSPFFDGWGYGEGS